MPGKTPDQIATKWQQNLANSGPAYTAGIQSVTNSPTAAAAAQQDKWARKVQEAAASNRFSNALNSVSLQDWKNAAVSKGASRLTSGAAQAKPKFLQFITTFQPAMEAVSAAVKQMPKNTMEDSLARVRFQMEAAKRAVGKL